MSTFLREEVWLSNHPIPLLLGAAIDCSASISNEQFEKARAAIVKLLIMLHERAGENPRQPSDWVSLTGFGGASDIRRPSGSLAAVKMDRRDGVAGLAGWVGRLRNDGRQTALRDATLVAAASVASLDQQLPYQYFKGVLTITDGDDNASRSSIADLHALRAAGIALVCVGVGRGASGELARLMAVSDIALGIDSFDDLYPALVRSITTVVRSRSTLHL